ncbi:MAG: hypothetical protein K0U18_06070 [Betaproteobacteria bacterium]|jgi:hypothetical protein|nr:hypothetical protein [Betaproteobacteria bacterium]MCH9849426.1 hypothetical protein [Betaproteobacteria bacterium]MDG1097706.1 hypothetical protein [Methylophilaceae bacterium]MDG1452903.1 hypothetical protein [Methylophilaceae bacterium]
MDTFSHALWGYGLFGYKRYALLAIFFGAMPDLISFGALMAMNVIDGTMQFGKPALESLPPWLYSNYAIGHSFLISLPIIGLVALWRKGIAFAMLAWPFHIVLDFPFHTKAYFATPIFWPLSDFRVDGIAWSHWYIWWPNVAGIVILLCYRYRQKKKAI